MERKKHLCMLCKKTEVKTPYSTCKECRLLCELCGVNRHNGSGWGMCDSCEEKERQRQRYFNSDKKCPFCSGRVTSYEHYNGLYDEEHWSCDKCEKEFSCDEFLKLEIYVDGACDFCKEKAEEHGAVKVMCKHKY